MYACRRPLRALAITIVGSISIGGIPLARADQPLADPPPGNVVEESTGATDAADSPRDETVSLPELLAWADLHAPALRSARSHAGLAIAERLDAEPLLPQNPELATRFGGIGGRGGAGAAFGVSLDQPIGIAGARAARRRAAEATGRRIDADSDAVARAVRFEVCALAVEAQLARERTALADRMVAFAAAVHETAAARVAAGDEAPLALLVTESDHAAMRAARIDASREERSLRARIAGLIGWPDALVPPIRGSLPPVRPAPPLGTLDARMSTSHPALVAREAAIREASARAVVAERDSWPEPTIGLSWDRELPPDAAPAEDLWLVHLAVPIPLWDTNQGDRARADAALRIAEAERDEDARRLRTELVDAWIALDAAAERVAVLDDDVLARVDAQLAVLQRAWERGDIDVEPLSATRARLLELAIRALDARLDYHRAALALEAIVGDPLRAAIEEAP